MKIALRGPECGWVVDYIVKDYIQYTRHQVVGLDNSPDVFWCTYLFDFPRLINSVYDICMPVVHIHHIDETKINEYDFKSFNRAYCCIVYNKKVEEVAKKYMDIPVYRLPYWVLSTFLEPRDDNKVSLLRDKMQADDFLLIGSFIKDGNGNLGNTPKWSKGPDVFVEVLEKISKTMKVKVVLAGYARAYMMNELKKRSIPFVYLERYDNIPSLYDSVDWYLVTSRCEGGPQSVLEASYRKVNILSTDVGVASEILHPDCICNSVDDFIFKIRNGVNRIDFNHRAILQNHMPNKTIPIWDNFFEDRLNEWRER